MWDIWNWLNSLSGGAASFVGSLAGSAIGLIALLLGALYNARLNRLRDERLRNADARALATALRAELSGIAQTLLANAATLKDNKDGRFVPDLSHSITIMPQLSGKIGLLDVTTIGLVADAYIMVDQFGDSLAIMGGRLEPGFAANRRVFFIPADSEQTMLGVIESTTASIKKAMAGLDKYIS